MADGQRHDIRIIDLYTGRILAEVRRVDKDHAIRAVRALIAPHLPDPDTGEWGGVAGSGWAVQPAVKVKREGRWQWVGPLTAERMGVFPKRDVAAY